MKIKTLIFLFFLTAGFWCCIDDNSRAVVTELNNISIDGLQDKYSVTLQDYLVITPELEMDDTNVSYVWYTYSAMSGSQRDTLSTERNLNVQITGQRAIPGIDYYLVYRVIDNRTGVYTSKSMLLSVYSTYTKGLLLLTDRASIRRLDMLLDDGTLYQSVYEANNESLLSNEIDEVYFADPSSIRPDLKQIFLFGEPRQGGMTIDPVTMTRQFSMREMLEPEPAEENLVCTRYMGILGNIEYMILNGKLNKRRTNMSDLRFQSSSMVVYGTPTDYEIGGIIAHEAQPVIYDALNGRLLAHHPWNMGSLLMANPATSDFTHFDPNDIGDFDYVCSGRISANNYWMILKERVSGDYYLFKFSCVRTTDSNRKNVINFTSTGKVRIDPSHAPNIMASSRFVANQSIINTAFYFTNNKLYALNTSVITEPGGPNAEAVILDFNGSDLTIDNILFPSVIVPAPTEENPNATRISHQLRFLVRDGSLSTLPGGIIFYEITTVGGIQANEVFRKIGGFCDKVIDLEEKYS